MSFLSWVIIISALAMCTIAYPVTAPLVVLMATLCGIAIGMQKDPS